MPLTLENPSALHRPVLSGNVKPNVLMVIRPTYDDPENRGISSRQGGTSCKHCSDNIVHITS